MTRPLASGFVYSLGKSLYIPLTSRCNTVTLPETRGPTFLLPAQVVASLCRVRDAENQKEQWTHWCMYLDMQETLQKLPKTQESVASLQPTLTLDESGHDGLQPTVEEILAEVHQLWNQGVYESIVFAGEGEPTLRPNALISLASHLKTNFRNVPPLRLTTNGLICNEQIMTQLLHDANFHSVSVALMTHDPDQYDEIMKPLLDVSSSLRAHEHVCEFIHEALAAGLSVETTGVERPDVDKIQTEGLAASLGVTKPFRWRSYHA
jgi:organic radical activating enzyme